MPCAQSVQHISSLALSFFEDKAHPANWMGFVV